MGAIRRNYKTKSFWGGVAAVVTAIGAIMGVPIPQEVFIIIGGLEAIFLRDAMSKNQ